MWSCLPPTKVEVVLLKNSESKIKDDKWDGGGIKFSIRFDDNIKPPSHPSFAYRSLNLLLKNSQMFQVS